MEVSSKDKWFRKVLKEARDLGLTRIMLNPEDNSYTYEVSKVLEEL